VIRRLRTGGWSFTTRLLALALVPAALMFVVVNISLYLVSADEAAAEVRERARIVAAALAEGTRYGVISGNRAAVERTVRGLMQADRSIVAVEVLDMDRAPLVSVSGSGATGNAFTTESPITVEAIDVDLLDTGRARKGSDQARGTSADPLAGHVRVSMSPAPLLEAKRSRLLLGSALVLLATVISATVGLALARRLRKPLNLVMAALRSIRGGRFDVVIERTASGELGELQDAITDMARGLDVTHQRMDQEVARRTLQLQEAMQAAQIADAERRRLIARGNELIEDERRRLSLEIHDELNAALVAVRLHANALAAKAQDSGDADLQTGAQRIATLTDDLYRRARAIVSQLRPEMIDTLGLPGAIEEMVRRFDEAATTCRFTFETDGTIPPVDEQVAITAYRVAQEALSNVAKHAHATQCSVALQSVTLEDGRSGIRLVVSDDGRGIATDATPGRGVGLIGMRERVAGLSGLFVLSSSPDLGTTVTVDLPTANADRV
jgi:two-component system, NarL family, sensor histidine kinase UhpB